MESFIQILIMSADTFSGLVSVFFASVADGIGFVADAVGFVAGGDIVPLALAAAVTTYTDIPEEILTAARRWHGKIDEQYSNIENVIVTIQAHPAWGTPPTVFSQIISNRTQLSTLIPKCRSTHGSPADREQRNYLLKATVGICLGQVKAWAYTQYYNNIMTLADVHSLGFLLPGEAGGKHGRAEAVDVLAEVKVKIISPDIIRVIIDQASGDNAALVVHGWPPGVRMAVIVITAADGVTEVLRLQTSHLHNDIQMPDGSHGKQFIIKASFLRHIDDKPRFGSQPTFSMPLTTEDLAAALDHQHHEEHEANIREIERLRREIEQLSSRRSPDRPADS